jgi:uncharacterized protein YndB with AHSA1/START domain/DNA-binding transcriptional ArsR family regulator
VVECIRMKDTLSAMADESRWRILQLLAERPRSVGEVVELTGLRQPQATKHLQTLAQSGLARVFPLGQRRVYAIEVEPVQNFRQALDDLLATAGAHQAEREIVARYWAAIQADASQADKDRWADGRHFTFTRLIAHPRELVWAYWINPDLLAGWWAPPSLKVAKCLIEPEPAGRVVLEFDGSGERHVSKGQVLSAERPERLIFDLTVLNRIGAAAFTAHYDLALAESDGDKCRLRLDMRITDTTVEALPFIAGIETGWNQVLDQLQASIRRDA